MTDPTRDDPGPALPEGWEDVTDDGEVNGSDARVVYVLEPKTGCSLEVWKDVKGLYLKADAAAPEAVFWALARAGVLTAPDESKWRAVAEYWAYALWGNVCRAGWSEEKGDNHLDLLDSLWEDMDKASALELHHSIWDRVVSEWPFAATQGVPTAPEPAEFRAEVKAAAEAWSLDFDKQTAYCMGAYAFAPRTPGPTAPTVENVCVWLEAQDGNPAAWKAATEIRRRFLSPGDTAPAKPSEEEKTLNWLGVGPTAASPTGDRDDERRREWFRTRWPDAATFAEDNAVMAMRAEAAHSEARHQELRALLPKESEKR